MSALDWIAASSLARCTGRVEVLTADGWLPQGTAFYIGCRTLLTCAHVIPQGSEIRVVMLSARRLAWAKSRWRAGRNSGVLPPLSR